MNKIILFCILLVFPFFCSLLAQNPDTIPVRQIVEDGTKGDIILGNEYKKNQLIVDPQLTTRKKLCKKKEGLCLKKKSPKKHNPE